MPILVPCLVTLRSEFTALAPNRDKASDGWIADFSHVATGTSDHIDDEASAYLKNKDADSVHEVHAIDVDSDLKKSGWSMTRAVGIIVVRHRQGLDDRLHYAIWNRTIWSESWGWTARAYTGVSPHTEHGHFSAKYSPKQEADTRPWGLLEAAKPVVVKPAPVKKPATGPKPGSRTLRKGMTGPDVAYLRRWLGLSNVEKFDAALDAKVRSYQRMRGITVDGIVGPTTWRNVGVKVS